MMIGIVRRSEGGATLVEMIVAVIIIAVGLLPLTLALNRIYTNSYLLGTRSEAQLLAAERIDEFKLRGFLDVATDTLGSAVSVTVNEGALSTRPYTRSTEVRFMKLTDTTLVNAVPADLPVDFIQLTSTVSWTAEGKTTDRTLKALMAREGSFE